MLKTVRRSKHGPLGRRFDMSNLIEIQEAIEKLAPQERAELWEWFQAQEVEETDEMLAAVDEGIRSIEEQGGTPAEEVRKLIPKWITK